jgi:hypothetical protein
MLMASEYDSKAESLGSSVPLKVGPSPRPR